MRGNVKGKITLLLLIGLVFFMGFPVVIPTMSQQIGINGHRDFIRTYIPHEAILLDGNEEMIAQAEAENWSGNGSEESPYIISGYYFYDIMHSVEIRHIDLHWVFTDNEIDGPATDGVWCGMEVSNSKNGLIINNLFHNRWRGLWLVNIYNIVVTHNIMEDNLFHGMECVGFANTCVISDNTLRRNHGFGIGMQIVIDSEISGNDISNNDGTGIWILGDATNYTITGNIIDSVIGLGIYLGTSALASVTHNTMTNCSGDGISVFESDNFEVYNNTLENGGENGIVISTCILGLIHNNTIIDMDGIGVQIASGGNSTLRFNHVEDAADYGLKTDVEAENMSITRNIFINNGDSVQICDDGTDNLIIYNFYDDWTSPDANSDQIVDVPYVFDGDAENEDPYPLTSPNAIPPSSVTTSTSTTTTTSTEFQIPLELVGIGAGAVVLVVMGVFFLRRRN